jgi:mRNA interferase MazF
MKRGEIWTVAGGAAYAGKPRPAVIIQDNRFDANDSIIVCPLTTDPTSAPIFRLPIPSNTRTGLRAPCKLMVDKLTAVPRKRVGTLVGTLSPDELKALNRSVFVFLGLAETEATQGLASHAARRTRST